MFSQCLHDNPSTPQLLPQSGDLENALVLSRHFDVDGFDSGVDSAQHHRQGSSKGEVAEGWLKTNSWKLRRHENKSYYVWLFFRSGAASDYNLGKTTFQDQRRLRSTEDAKKLADLEPAARLPRQRSWYQLHLQRHCMQNAVAPQLQFDKNKSLLQVYAQNYESDDVTKSVRLEAQTCRSGWIELKKSRSAQPQSKQCGHNSPVTRSFRFTLNLRD